MGLLLPFLPGMKNIINHFCLMKSRIKDSFVTVKVIKLIEWQLYILCVFDVAEKQNKL